MTSERGPKQREESTQFSLTELMKLEDERLAEVARDREQATTRAAEARAAAEQKERDAETARAQAEAEAGAARRRAELEEVARREAMQKAIVEQARLDVEVRARAEERELERRHELELQRLRGEGKKGHLGSLAGACLFGGAVVFGLMLAIHFGVTKPAADRRVAEAELRLATASMEATDVGRRLAEQQRRADALERKLDGAETELRALRDRPPTRSTPSPPPRTGVRAAPAHEAPPPQPPCLKGDPMCP